MWRQEPPAVLRHFATLAAAEKAAHRQRHPGYRVRNRRPSEIKRRSRNVTNIVVNKPVQVHDQLTSDDFEKMLTQVEQSTTNNPLPLHPEETFFEEVMTEVEDLQDMILAQSENLSGAAEQTLVEDVLQQPDDDFSHFIYSGYQQTPAEVCGLYGDALDDLLVSEH